MRVLITRPREQSASFSGELQAIGADPIYLPTIAIKPVEDKSQLDKSLSRLNDYAWLVLTSANAAAVVLERLTVLKAGALPKDLRVAAIGPKTGAKLKAAGIAPDYVPEQYIAEAIIPGLGDLRGRWVLLPVADIAHDTLPKAIQAADGIPHVISVYHTVLAEPDPNGVAALRSGVDVITFTSSSTVRNFFTLCQNAGIDSLNLPSDPTIACIGPKTAQTARDLGLVVDIVADPHTTAGLVAKIKSLSDWKPLQ
jgi:uroporphyrinogen-III synthase